MAAIEDKCIRTLAHKCTEHAAVTALEILTHLKTTCGKIDEGMLEDNLENMKKDWDPNDTFETLVQQIENAVDLAEEGGDPISNTAQLNCGCKRVHNTGLFNVECTTWRNKAAADKNWATFKVFLEKRTMTSCCNKPLKRQGVIRQTTQPWSSSLQTPKHHSKTWLSQQLQIVKA